MVIKKLKELSQPQVIQAIYVQRRKRKLKQHGIGLGFTLAHQLKLLYKTICPVGHPHLIFRLKNIIYLI